jgi:penicillin-binding protein 2
LNGIDFAGKTGSAQTVSHEGRAKGLGGKMRDNAWFVGLTPRRNPEIAVCILWEGGMRGYLSARRAAMVIEAYVDKQRRLENNLRQASVATPAQPGEIAAVWHEAEGAQPAQKTPVGHVDGHADLHGGRFPLNPTAAGAPPATAEVASRPTVRPPATKPQVVQR